MYVIGLTGGIGSGKTTVADGFAELGITLVDADLLAREVVEPGTPALKAIAEKFGNTILNTDGSLNRPKLRELIFANETEKQWLEALLHPLIRNLMLDRLNSARSPYAILVSPLLLETDQKKLVNRVLVIDIPTEVQLHRTVQRDGSNEETIKSIINSQMNRETRLSFADDIIVNDQTTEELTPKILDLHQHYLQLSGDKL